MNSHVDNKFCLPIQRASKAQVLKLIDESQCEYQFFEVWLDYIVDLDDAFVRHLVELYGETLIVVFHRSDNKPTTMNLQKRQFYLQELSGGKGFVDLDIRREREELEFLKLEQLQVKTIVSFHDYEKTPCMAELLAVIDEMEKLGVSVYKVSTLCSNEADAVRLLELQLALKAKGVEYIVLGMGVHGAVTRVFGTLWGNKLIFAPKTEAERSAPGQLTQQQLRDIFETLKIK